MKKVIKNYDEEKSRCGHCEERAGMVKAGDRKSIEDGLGVSLGECFSLDRLTR